MTENGAVPFAPLGWRSGRSCRHIGVNKELMCCETKDCDVTHRGETQWIHREHQPKVKCSLERDSTYSILQLFQVISA